jgi:hypothetical protein
VLDEHVPFLEAAFVEQQLEALARGELALGVLGGDALLAAARRAAARFFSSCSMMSCMVVLSRSPRSFGMSGSAVARRRAPRPAAATGRAARGARR